MATLGTATVKIEPELSAVFAIVIAAVRLHDALRFTARGESTQHWPDDVTAAYMALHHAIMET